MTPFTRERVFPDFGQRQSTDHLLGAFDPANLHLYVNPRTAVSEEQALLEKEGFPGAEKLIAQKLGALPSDTARLDYAFRVTTHIHELRHFHDVFSTTVGFRYFLKHIEDAVEFFNMWQRLRSRGKIKLPLALWALESDAPAELLNYRSKRRAFVEWINLYAGNMQPVKREGRSDKVGGYMVYRVGGLETAVPSLIVNLRAANEDRYDHVVMPLGLRLLLEGAAFVIQRAATSRLFGDDFWQPLKEQLMAGSATQLKWLDYMAVDIYLTKEWTKYYERFQLGFTDLALMAEPVDEIDKYHPGWRFMRAIDESVHDASPYKTEATDLVQAIDAIATKCKWNKPQQVAVAAAKDCEHRLAEIRSQGNENTRSFWHDIIEAANEIHLNFLRIREKVPALFAEPDLYFEALRLLPPPPVYSDGRELQFRGKSQRHALAFRQWYLLEHIQRQLMFDTEIPCPGLGGQHSCAGNPVGRWFWRPSPTCPFSHLAQDLGIPALKVDKLQ